MRGLAALSVVAIVVQVAPAAAQDDEAKQAAIEAIARGDAAFKKQDFAGALAAYQEAYQLFPSAKIFYAMAKAEERLGRILEALDHYERFLAEVGGEVSEDVRIDVEVSIQELGKQIVVVTFEVTPADASVLVDGAPVDPRQPLRLSPSKHAIIVEKPGFTPHSEQIDPAAGERPTLSVTLEPVAVAEPEPPQPEPEPPPAPAERGHGWRLWTGVGVTTALTAGWAITGLYAGAAHDDFGDSGLGLEERLDARDRGRNLALASDVLLFGAVVAAGFTAYLYFGAEDDDAPPSQALVPVVFPGGGGAALAGEF